MDNPIITYLPLESWHIVPVFGLSPESLQRSLREIDNTFVKGKQPSSDQILDSICRRLGYTDWADFNNNYPLLKDFKAKHNLKKYTSFLPDYSGKNPAKLNGPGSMFRDNLSGRLFNSGKPLPQKVFIGKDVSRYELEDYGIDYYTGIPKYIIPNLADEDFASSERWAQARIKSQSDPDYEKALMGQIYMGTQPALNFLGDNLFLPETKSGYILQIYYPKIFGKDFRPDLRSRKQQFGFFKNYISRSSKGWAEVLPFNNNIIFLKYGDEYDFLLRDEKLRLPEIHSKLLLPENAQNKINRFAAEFIWHDFFRKGAWREMEEHKAEIWYYNTGGFAGFQHPGHNEIRKKYLLSKGLLPPKKRSKRKPGRSKKVKGFFKEDLIDGSSLFVSNMITNAQFRMFMKVTDYKPFRNDEQKEFFEKQNQGDKHQPACVSWLDAQAYADWLSGKYNTDLRLLTLNEARQIFPFGCDIRKSLLKKDSNCPEILKYENKPYCLRYNTKIDMTTYAENKIYRSIHWYEKENGLRFFWGHSLREWLYRPLDGLYYPQTIYVGFLKLDLINEKLRVQKNFTKKYFEFSELNDHIIGKRITDTYSHTMQPEYDLGEPNQYKIGFRLCYPDHDSTPPLGIMEPIHPVDFYPEKIGTYTFKDHARFRAFERNISRRQMETTLKFGRKITCNQNCNRYKRGNCKPFCTKHILFEDQIKKHNLPESYLGTEITVDHANNIPTLYMSSRIRKRPPK